MTLDQNHSILPFRGTALKMVGGGGHRRNREMLLPSRNSSCYCSPDAEEGVPTVTEFLAEFQQNVLDGNEALAQCIGSVTSIEEIRIFDCNDDEKDEFETYLKAEFTGDLSMLTEEEVLTLEETILVVFQELEDMVCDTSQRSLTSVRTVARGPVDEEDATALSGGSSSSAPVAPPALRRRELDEDDTNQPSPSTTANTTSTPTAAPSFRPTTSTQLPTFYPTTSDVQTPTPTASPTSQGVHTGFSTFYLMLELTGDCRGCSTDTGSLFDNQVIPERRRRQRKLQLPEQLRSANKEPLPWRFSGSRKLEGHTGKCGCGLESPDGGVTIQEFESNFATQVEVLALPNVISLNGVMELTSISPIPTPAPTMPQPTSSETPTADSELSSSFTSPQITSLPTFSPAPTDDSDTSSPTFSPTSIPTNAPTPDPTVLPTPSPTSAPSTPAPTSKSPSSSPTPLPTPPPTPTPSAKQTPEPTQGPTPASGGGDGDCIAINRGDSSATNGVVEASFETLYAIVDFSETGLQPLSQYTLEQFNGFEKIFTDNEYYVVLEKGWVTMENPGFMLIRSPHNEGDPELETFSDPTCVGVNSI